MKSTDKEIKNSFYEAETAMENIRASLMVDTREAYQAACQATMVEFISLNSSNRQSFYYKKFVQAMESDINAQITTYGGLEAYLQNVSGYGTNITTASVGLELHEDEGYVVIRDVHITYNKDGYVTMITTDFLVKAPEVDWGTESSQTTWVTGEDPAVVLTRIETSMADSVIYCNWKKE